MSETMANTTDEAANVEDAEDTAPLTPPPGYSATPTLHTIANKPRPALDITFGAGRSAKVCALTAGEQLDIIELAGANATNAYWMTLATAVRATRWLNGKAFPAPVNRAHLRNRLEDLDDDGLTAVLYALRTLNAPPATEKEHRAAVGESQGTTASA